MVADPLVQSDSSPRPSEDVSVSGSSLPLTFNSASNRRMSGEVWGGL